MSEENSPNLNDNDSVLASETDPLVNSTTRFNYLVLNSLAESESNQMSEENSPILNDTDSVLFNYSITRLNQQTNLYSNFNLENSNIIVINRSQTENNNNLNGDNCEFEIIVVNNHNNIFQNNLPDINQNHVNDNDDNNNDQWDNNTIGNGSVSSEEIRTEENENSKKFWKTFYLKSKRENKLSEFYLRFQCFRRIRHFRARNWRRIFNSIDLLRVFRAHLDVYQKGRKNDSKSKIWKCPTHWKPRHKCSRSRKYNSKKAYQDHFNNLMRFKFICPFVDCNKEAKRLSSIENHLVTVHTFLNRINSVY